MTTVRQHTSFPSTGDGNVFTDEAVAGLIGQQPMLLREPGDWKTACGRATITAAAVVDGRVMLDLELPPLPPDIAARVHENMGVGAGAGYTVVRATRGESDRLLQQVDMLNVYGGVDWP